MITSPQASGGVCSMSLAGLVTARFGPDHHQRTVLDQPIELPRAPAALDLKAREAVRHPAHCIAVDQAICLTFRVPGARIREAPDESDEMTDGD